MENKLETNLTITIIGKAIYTKGRFVGSKADLFRLAGHICGILGVTPEELEGDPIKKMVLLIGMMDGAGHDGTGTTTIIEVKPEGKEE